MLFGEIIAIYSENQKSVDFLNVKASVENSYHKMPVKEKKTPWLESANELFLPSDRRRNVHRFTKLKTYREKLFKCFLLCVAAQIILW
jgi:Holliday junction resolvase-like predicted endonuclease